MLWKINALDRQKQRIFDFLHIQIRPDDLSIQLKTRNGTNKEKGEKIFVFSHFETISLRPGTIYIQLVWCTYYSKNELNRLNLALDNWTDKDETWQNVFVV